MSLESGDFCCRIAVPEADGSVRRSGGKTLNPSGDHAMLLTKALCPLSVAISVAELLSQSRTVLSEEAEARRNPSGDHAMLLTKALCPLSVAISVAELLSQSRTVMSSEAEARAQSIRRPRYASDTAVVSFERGDILLPNCCPRVARFCQKKRRRDAIHLATTPHSRQKHCVL